MTPRIKQIPSLTRGKWVFGFAFNRPFCQCIGTWEGEMGVFKPCSSSDKLWSNLHSVTQAQDGLCKHFLLCRAVRILTADLKQNTQIYLLVIGELNTCLLGFE